MTAKSTTDSRQSTANKMAIPLREKMANAADRRVTDVVSRLPHMRDATLIRLIEAARFEQLIRAQARTTDDDAGGTT